MPDDELITLQMSKRWVRLIKLLAHNRIMSNVGSAIGTVHLLGVYLEEVLPEIAVDDGE